MREEGDGTAVRGRGEKFYAKRSQENNNNNKTRGGFPCVLAQVRERWRARERSGGRSARTSHVFVCVCACSTLASVEKRDGEREGAGEGKGEAVGGRNLEGEEGDSSSRGSPSLGFCFCEPFQERRHQTCSTWPGKGSSL